MHKQPYNQNQQHPVAKYSHKQTFQHHQQKSKAQEGSLLSLLRRNRSLKELQQLQESHRNQGGNQLEDQKGQTGKKKTLRGQLGEPKQQKRQRNELKKLIGDEYLIVQKGQKPRKEKAGKIGTEMSNKKELSKIISSRQRSQIRLGYDPNNYNWRKSQSKSEDRLRINQSPKVIQPFRISQSQYYPAHMIKNQDEAAKQQERPKSRASSGHGRSKSALSKPKVVKNVFEVLTPKPKRNSHSSTKGLFFTFGL